jgi:putative Holliday junction resolvase
VTTTETPASYTCLGFDYGSKRIGVAVGQSLTGTASALTTLNTLQGQPDWKAISTLIQEWQPSRLIVGLPVNKDGSLHDTSKAAQRFGNRLNGRYNLPVYHVDERLSSSEAEQRLSHRSGKYSRADIDKLAAQIILETWFAQQT